MLNHNRKRLVEEYLVESPLTYTILQPFHGQFDRSAARKGTRTRPCMWRPTMPRSWSASPPCAATPMLRWKSSGNATGTSAPRTRSTAPGRWTTLSTSGRWGTRWEIPSRPSGRVVRAGRRGALQALVPGPQSLADVDLRNRDSPRACRSTTTREASLGVPESWSG